MGRAPFTIDAGRARTLVRMRESLPSVLFVCVHNAGRSQMAAALLERHAAGRVRVRSAGSEPADRLHASVVEVMAEVGVDLTRERPKLLRDEAVRDSDVVITMGCGDACPVFPGIRYEDWDLEDPSGKPIEDVRRIRDDIDGRVRRLLEGLTGQADSAERSEASGSGRTRK
jgi:arsenate reductase (thioredoxin)